MNLLPYKDIRYFYTVKCPTYEESLCIMEMIYLFNKIPEKGYLFSSFYVEPDRSVFIKHCISIIYTGNNLEDIVEQIKRNNLSYEKFKVTYIFVTNENMDYYFSSLGFTLVDKC